MEHVPMPRAREEQLHVEHVGDEVLIYDLRTDTAHRLPGDVARVWAACDGETPVAECATGLGAGSELADVLAELDEKALLAEPAPAVVSRRHFVVRAAAAAASAPMILSVVAPSPAMAVSTCAARFASCASMACCAGYTCRDFGALGKFCA